MDNGLNNTPQNANNVPQSDNNTLQNANNVPPSDNNIQQNANVIPQSTSNIPISDNSTQIITTYKKEKSNVAFFFHIFLSFVVYNLIIHFFHDALHDIIVRKIGIFGILKVKNIILLNVIWIIASIFNILLTYISNRKNTVKAESLSTMKFVSFFIFIVGILGINYKLLHAYITINPVVSIILICIHIAVIFFFNNKYFKKYIED